MGKATWRRVVRISSAQIVASIVADRIESNTSYSCRGRSDCIAPVFCTFYGDKIVLLYQGYDKKSDPSQKRQQLEIAKARKAHARWKSGRRT